MTVSHVILSLGVVSICPSLHVIQSTVLLFLPNKYYSRPEHCIKLDDPFSVNWKTKINVPVVMDMTEKQLNNWTKRSINFQFMRTYYFQILTRRI